MSESGPVRILCIEDDPTLARLIQKNLVRAGYAVDVAHDGEAGLCMAQTGTYDVLTVDHVMPRMQGLEVIRRLAEGGTLPPAIMVTGGGNETVAVEAMKLGASDYIVKDVPGGFLELLPAVIEQVLQRRRLAEERERALAALQVSEARLRSLFEDNPVGLYRTAPDGRLLDANPALVEMLGFPDRETLLKANAKDFYLDPEDRRQWQLQMDQSRDVVLHHEAWLRRRDGQRRWMRDSARAIRDLHGRLLHYDGALQDITERKLVEESLREHTAELQERNAELDAFSHTVAHDLKDPLSSIIGYTEMLLRFQNGSLEKQAQEYLHIILQGGQRMNNIIDALLLLASVRIRDVEMLPLDMSQIVAAARQRLRYIIHEVKAEMIEPPSWPAALGHAEWVEAVWSNYLSNALKYGGRPPRVELGFHEQENGMVRFWVRDNGPGIPEEDQDRLFIPFTRLKQARAEGHGLGLSIVQRIVKRLGGEVGLESVPEQGSLFYFTLPAARVK